MNLRLESKWRELEAVLEMWETHAHVTPFSEDWTAEECKRIYGEVEVDDEVLLITNSAMKTIVEFMEVVKKINADADRDFKSLRWDMRCAREDAEFWKKRACMSDSRISDLVFEYMEWAKANDNEETLQWTDVKLLEIVRGRMK